MSTKNSYIIKILRIIVTVILLQTLFFKFTGSDESVYIFTKLGVEPYGRIGSGIVELLASIFLFINKTKFYASITAMLTMLGALFSHLFVLGIEIMNDGGLLFILACITFLLSAFLSFQYKDDILNQLKKI